VKKHAFLRRTRNKFLHAKNSSDKEAKVNIAVGKWIDGKLVYTPSTF
jgi:hypothetical protein